MEKGMRIGDLAKRAGITPRTVRYYESIGLIPQGEREGDTQHYYYSYEILELLKKIGQLKKVGLSLDEIRDLSQLYFIDPSGVSTKRKILTLLRQHHSDTEQKMNDLKEFQNELQSLIDHFERWFSEREGE
ncbi:MerR family transcriptional regulator [Peribacillus muralis]|uniref:MerR family transcriptional regulator n=1 Tax=Peribacillus muralis TaxID=264697 RepID=UPI001F4DDA17|nr:MerR family transcriptional regulator [Peribacillus muralis]MCK1992346.1 MerR family transcriptional regulator [Peribacillus muralis]MCK2012902.1 MerR family transcriptional regulator [Peribacillus muralis]